MTKMNWIYFFQVVSIQNLSLLSPMKTASIMILSCSNGLARVQLSTLWPTIFVTYTFLMVPVNLFRPLLVINKIVIVTVKTIVSTERSRSLAVPIHFAVVVLLVSIKSLLTFNIRWLPFKFQPMFQPVKFYSFECTKLAFELLSPSRKGSPMV